MFVMANVEVEMKLCGGCAVLYIGKVLRQPVVSFDFSLINNNFVVLCGICTAWPLGGLLRSATYRSTEEQ